MADTTNDLPYIVHADLDTEPADKVQVQAPPGKGEATAQALLAAADDLDLDPSVVETSDGHFLVPADVADKAKLPEGDTVVEDVAGGASNPANASHDGVAPEFATKADAQAFAKANDLDVKDATSDEYKAAVAKAYADRAQH